MYKNYQDYTIATLGSHSALQILKGAKDEGFKTLLITTNERADFYNRFSFIDTVTSVVSFKELPKIKDKKTIIIPHGSFVAYLGMEGNKNMTVPYFGSKKVLDYEADRKLQYDWLEKSKLTLPKQYELNDKNIRFPVIVKSHGAAGGRGYFLAMNKRELIKKLSTFKYAQYVIQQYIIGVPLYIHYFYSLLTKQVEIMSIDRRYETNVDGIGRIPQSQQKDLSLETSYVVVGNSPFVLRESLLPEALNMGERVVESSKKVVGGKGLYGPFCLETIITPDQKICVIEISCRIVAGTNLFINGSPYSWLTYNEPMSTGRRIAREIKNAIITGVLEENVD